MFEGGGVRSGAEAEVASLLADVGALDEVTVSCRAENRFAARKVLAAGRFWESWIERDVRLGSGDIVDCGNGAIAELAVRMGCSKTVAESYASLGMDLRLRLPLARAAFESGELDLPRVRAIARATTGLKPETVAALEPGIVAAARQLTPGPLAGEIGRLVSEFSAEEAAAQRNTAQELGRRIVKRSRGNTSTIEVTVSPEEAEQVMQLVAEFAATVCPFDKRGRQCRLVDAVLAMMHGEPYLRCSCGREDCAQAGRTALPGRRAPLTQVTIDIATLLGLLSEPAYLHGHGLIDPELARALAADGTWQALLTEALNLAEELGLVTHGEDANSHSARRDADCQDRDRGDGIEPSDRESGGTVDDIAPEPEPAADAEEPEPETDGESSVRAKAGSLIPETPPPSSPLPPRFCVRSYLARGSRRKAGYVPEYATPAPPRPRTSPPPPTSIGTITDAILAAIVPQALRAGGAPSNPTLARPEHPDGHGGHTTPPGGALTYRPDAATIALVHARDGHCRFPGCTRPAAGCQLDHIIEYRAHDPIAGGWTIPGNLHCLCRYHHQLKT
uniref:HNH endonuclease signature motif containing protein n=1 Tax=Rhodococcus sp. UNC363MFTsu5.1 TaxID=1449069 RepID=UPI00048A3EC9